MRLLFILPIAFLLVACGGDKAKTNSLASGTPDPRTVDGQIEMMRVVFYGHHSAEEIKRKMDIAMNLYGVELTPENYGRAGSVLVALREKRGPTEMAILNYMIKSYTPAVNLSFPDAAGLAVGFLPVDAE
jgi:hypothetical protein